MTKKLDIDFANSIGYECSIFSRVYMRRRRWDCEKAIGFGCLVKLNQALGSPDFYGTVPKVESLDSVQTRDISNRITCVVEHCRAARLTLATTEARSIKWFLWTSQGMNPIPTSKKTSDDSRNAVIVEFESINAGRRMRRPSMF